MTRASTHKGADVGFWDLSREQSIAGFDPERKSQTKTVRISGTDTSQRIRRWRKCEVPHYWGDLRIDQRIAFVRIRW
jgi:hypothetical protein